MNGEKSYLGDGVYAVLECGQIVLTTENGDCTTNVIRLEPEVVAALLRFVAALLRFVEASIAESEARP